TPGREHARGARGGRRRAARAVRRRQHRRVVRDGRRRPASAEEAADAGPAGRRRSDGTGRGHRPGEARRSDSSALTLARPAVGAGADDEEVMTVTVTTIKPEVVVSAALGILSREVVLPALVWRDAGGDFAGAKDDTISIR